MDEHQVWGWVEQGARERARRAGNGRPNQQGARGAPTRPAPRSVGQSVPEAVMQVDAAMRGAADVMSFGLANEIEAALGTRIRRADLSHIYEAWQASRARSAARTAFDVRHRGAARLGGEIAGVAMLRGGVASATTRRVEALPSLSKGNLGEFISYVRAFLRGDPVVRSQVRVNLSRGHTRADHQTLRTRFIESKLGRMARPTTPQKRAQRELGNRYLYEHFLPADVGRVVGRAGAGAGAEAALLTRERAAAGEGAGER